MIEAEAKLMLHVRSAQKLEAVEPALRSAAQRHGAQIISVLHLGQLLRDRQRKPARDAIVFSVCQPDLSAALLAEEMRFAAYLPCRIAAYEEGDGVVLEAIAPTEVCGLLGRPDLEGAALRLETSLLAVMQEASRAVAAAHEPAVAPGGGVGATEEQVALRRVVPQRIDAHGTKVEEIAGTGQHDSAGG
ncbi:MAG: DUF302 domain-containing protein [Bryobacterales bacterium]|nr:DUF302 domain-containing protein [Bryobacteraceae bacterium]MDW8353300.1 DUF302 domain-containing protein [Bryobacterales bacterium]